MKFNARKMLISVAMALAFLGATSAFAGEVVDINTADAKAIAAAMKGVGEKRAEAIIGHREQHGPFKSVDDLAQVRGVSASIVENSRGNLAVGSGSD